MVKINMSEVPFTIFLIALLIFTIVDKGLTLINLQQIQKNFPEANALKAEKNPINRFFFSKFGLYGGTIVMFFFSMFYSVLIWLSISWIFGNGSQNKTLYVIFIMYGFTIFNNLYFLLKYSKVIA